VDILTIYRITANDKNALRYLIKLRWPNGIRCPKCNSKEIGQPRNKRYYCKVCNNRFSLYTQTYLTWCKIKPVKLISAVKLFVLGLSALETSKELSLNYKTVLSLFDTMRLAIFHFNSDDKSQLSGEIEVDMRPILVAKGMVNKAEVHLIKYQFLG